MPIDRPPQNTLKPKLASNRTAKTPLTPRLAVAPAAPTSSSQVGRTVRSGNATTPRANTAVYEDVTPVKPFLSNNITPRSSSRKSRVGVESTASTPSSTPTTSRPTSSVDYHSKEHGVGYSGLGATGNRAALGGARPRSIPGQSGAQSALSPRPPLANNYNSAPLDVGAAKASSSLFFHASEARPQEPPPAQAQKKAPVFFYANGKQDAASRKSDVSSPPLSAMGRPQPASQFFHADSISEAKASTTNLIASPISTSPEPLNPNPAQAQSFRSPSPTKEWAHLSYRKGASQVIRPSIVSRNSAMSMLSGPNTPDVPDRSSRRSSAASYMMRGNHGKSASLSSIDSVTDRRTSIANEPPTLLPSPLHTENHMVSNGSFADSMASPPMSPTGLFSALPSPGSASPIKPSGTQTVLEAMNELAANARRERKVLDLEISNSSLLAINRSLEKEVRKQKAELRRFRRMSRAGRFAMDPAGSALDSSPIHAASHLAELSDMSEEDEVEELIDEEEDDPESSDESFDEGALSPSAQLERDEAHRFKDEKRLQLDLSKHRDLLLDSQKMNQSLKRCMNWTEQLIKDGQKALEYQVRPSDVKLGGRVLVVEDDEHDDNAQAEESRGLLSPWSPLHRAIDSIDALDSPFFAGAVERVVDRDSGVDVDGYEAAIDGYEASANTNNNTNSTTLFGSPFEERIQRLQASIEALS
jgi:hypothetical protein